MRSPQDFGKPSWSFNISVCNPNYVTKRSTKYAESSRRLLLARTTAAVRVEANGSDLKQGSVLPLRVKPQ